jgi:hypothetical protein
MGSRRRSLLFDAEDAESYERPHRYPVGEVGGAREGRVEDNGPPRIVFEHESDTDEGFSPVQLDDGPDGKPMTTQGISDSTDHRGFF